MSQWRYKLEGEEHGPVSFAELAELVRQRAVTETTQVCRVGSAQWESAWRVPTLLHAAGIVGPGDSPVKTGETEQPEQEAAAPATSSPWLAPAIRFAPITLRQRTPSASAAN